MKSIMYAGAALMIGAAFYGFADFKKTNTSREFKSMYEEKEMLQPASIPEKEPANKSVDFTGKKELVKETTTADDRKTNKAEIKPEPEETTRIKKPATEKELSPELFSRAPLKVMPEAAIKRKNKKSNTDQ